MTDLPPPRVRTLLPDDRDRAGAVLGRAFTDDPLWTAIMPEDETRPGRLTRMFTDLTRTLATAKGTLEMAESEAVALWLPPGRTLGTWAFVRSGFGTVRSMLALPSADRRRMMGVMRQLDAKRKEHAPEPHWYLLALGTDPDHQGRGLGTALVGAGTARADRADTRTYLETETEGNVGYYERLGFEVVEEVTAEAVGLPIWLMARPPHPPSLHPSEGRS